MNKVALLVAGVIALLGGALLFLYLQKFEQEASGGAPVVVLVARKSIDRGVLLTEDMVTTGSIPQAYVENRAVRAGERDRVLGLRMAIPLQANQTLMWTDLAIATDDRRDLSSLIQPGMRAVTVKASNDDKSFPLVRPGDRVDLLATLPQADKDNTQRSSVLLLQNILVLARGLDMGLSAPARGESDQNAALTLSLRIPEAQLLTLAIERGPISVALRSPNDMRVLEGIPDLSSEALGNVASRTGIQSMRRANTNGGPVRLDSPGGSP